MAATVCKHWRTVVLACPVAWSNLMYVLKVTEPRVRDDEWCIEEDDLDEINSPRGRHRPLDLWARRSQGTQFSLNIFVEQKYPQLEIRLLEDCRVLQGHLPRMRRLAISSEDGDVTSAILAMFSSLESRDATKAIRLSNLHLTARGDRLIARNVLAYPRDDVVTDFWDSVGTAHSLTFEGCQPPVAKFVHTKFDTARLRHLTLRTIYAPGTHLARTLGHFPNLETLELRQVTSLHWRNTEALPDRVTLSKLTHFTIARVSNQVCVNLLPYLHTPYLTHFSMRSDDFEELHRKLEDGSSPYNAMSELGDAVVPFAQSAPCVEVFHLAKTPLHDKHILAFLASWRALRELSFVELLVGAPIAHGLTPDGSSAMHPKPPLCPNLQVLRVEKCDLLPGNRLVSLVRIRNDPKSFTMPLTSLGVSHCENITPAHIAQIQMASSTHLRVHSSVLDAHLV